LDCSVQSLIDDLDGVVEELIVSWQCAERLDRLQRFVDEDELVKGERQLVLPSVPPRWVIALEIQ
jgi:hypothetical protein